MSIFIRSPWLEWNVYFKLLNLDIMTYLIIYQIEHIIKLNTFVKMANGFYSNGTFSQIGQTKMTCLLKMTNVFKIKLKILC
jgi:hypothetical protein